jgi:elongation factor G
VICGTELRSAGVIIVGEVPLANMFGYATDLRSATQGQGTVTMEVACYRQTPRHVQEEIVTARRKATAGKH